MQHLASFKQLIWEVFSMRTETLRKSPQEVVDLLDRSPIPSSPVPDLIQIAQAPEAVRDFAAGAAGKFIFQCG